MVYVSYVSYVSQKHLLVVAASAVLGASCAGLRPILSAIDQR